MKNPIFWDVMLRRMVNSYPRFVGSDIIFKVEAKKGVEYVLPNLE
jgi:hypothetical protein